MTVAKSFKGFASHVEGWVFEFWSQQTQVVKTGRDSSTAKRSEQVCVSRVFGDDHYKRMSRVTVVVQL